MNNNVLKLVICFVTLLLGIIINFNLEGLIGKSLGVESYGDYKVAIAVFIFVGQLLTFGFDNIVIRHLPNFIYQKNMPKAKFFISSTIKTVFIIEIIWFVGCFITYEALNTFSDHIQFARHLHPSIFYLFCAGTYALYVFAIKCVRAIGYNVTNMIFSQLPSLVFLVVILYFKHSTLKSVILIFNFSLIFVTCLALVIVFLYFRITEREPFELPKSIRKEAISYSLQQLFSVSTTTILLILVEALPNSEKDVGIIGLAFMFANMIFMITMVMKVMFSTKIAIAIEKCQIETSKVLREVFLTILIVLVAMFVLIYFFMPHTLLIFGNQFKEDNSLIPFALMGTVPGMLTIGEMIFSTFHPKSRHHVTSLLIGKVIFTFILGVILIKIFGIYGAIAAYIIVEVVTGIFLVYISRSALQKINS